MREDATPAGAMIPVGKAARQPTTFKGGCNS